MSTNIKWMLSKTIEAEKDDDICIFGSRESVTDNIIANIKNIKDASVLVIDIGDEIYNRTKDNVAKNGLCVHRFDASDPQTEGYDISDILDSGFYWELPDYFFHDNELHDMFCEDKEGKSLKYNQYRMLYCIYEYVVVGMGEKEIRSVLEMIEELRTKKGKEEKLKLFHEYDDKYGNWTPITDMLTKLDTLSEAELDIILGSLSIRLQEFAGEKNKVLLKGALGVDDLFFKPTAVYINLNRYQVSLTEQVVLYSILSRLKNIILDEAKGVEKKDHIQLYVIVNVCGSRINLPWKALSYLSTEEFVTMVTTMNSDWENETDNYWGDRFVARFSCGSWVAMDVYSEDDAEILSHRGGIKTITRKNLFKQQEKTIRKVSPDDIINMDSHKCYVRKSLGTSFDDFAMIDERFDC